MTCVSSDEAASTGGTWAILRTAVSDFRLCGVCGLAWVLVGRGMV